MRGRDNRDRWSRGNRDNRRGGYNRGGFGRGGSRGGPRGRGFGGGRDGHRFNSNNQWHTRPKNESPGQRLTEDQIGVTQYMSVHEGFNGIIKSRWGPASLGIVEDVAVDLPTTLGVPVRFIGADRRPHNEPPQTRYSDFQVSEINLEGEVAQLTNLSPPEPPAEEQVEEDEELLLTKYNVDILPMDMWDQINKVAVGSATEPVEIDVTTSTKEERTKIHEAVKKAFGDVIVGSTVNTDDKKLVRFEKYKKGVRVDNRVKWAWPGEFVHFMVHKENCDTMDAAVKIAERMRCHIKPSMLGYSGTKDRRAKTTQWFSLRKMDPRKIAAACRDLRELRVGNYSFHAHQLKLGTLKGNKFRIALRNVTAEDGAVDEACARLRDRGFINYYGLQRFGTRLEVPTFDIGMKLLKGNFQEAIDSILSAREGPLQEALALYAARGAGAALGALPRYALASVEARLLQALADRPNDLYYALDRIPRNTRLLYLHSYQSLVWNRAVSERVRRSGLAPAAGDLVPTAPEQIHEDTDDEESDNEESGENAEKPADTEKTTLTDNNSAENLNKTARKRKQEEKVKVPVKVLTQEDVDGGSYTIYDVIMPLPGYFIEYPPNMKDYYETLLTNDGLKLELRHKNKSYCLSGAYRHVAVRPAGVAWRRARYRDPHADLILSDLDQLEGRKLTGIVEDGTFKALLLTFSLPPSCYATMALRELLRADTSSHTQALLNNYHKRRADSDSHADTPANKKTKDDGKDDVKEEVIDKEDVEDVEDE